jgi:hypothetical protein
MSVRAALLLGASLVTAALVHGGIYSAGHDFVVNRFTGAFALVPAADERGPDALMPAAASARRRTLTSRDPGVRVARSSGRRAASHADRVGR